MIRFADVIGMDALGQKVAAESCGSRQEMMNGLIHT
jgi:hypothetical protein